MQLPKNKHLVIFDFDETLCKTNAFVKRRLLKEDGNFCEDVLTPGEYSAWRETGEYDLNPTQWDLDFSEFTGYPPKGEPIKETIEKLRDYLLDDSYICALVTGRDELSGPREFLNNWYIDTNSMILLCSADPNKKPCFEGLINTLIPSAVTIYEDCSAYIIQCEAVCAKYKIPCASILVGDGAIRWDWRVKCQK